MRHLIIAAVFVVASSAEAASVCASPHELKALQAAVLEQQLAAAAQSCHATADYMRFVAVYRGAIVRQDQAVRRFFQHQKAGERYDSYKTRIARDVSLKSLHDPRFCRTARIVFDLALSRREAAEPPALVQTGYEGCRPVIERPVMAMAAAKPTPSASRVPVPSLAPVRLAEAIPIPKPAPFGPRALAIVNAVKPVTQTLPKPVRVASVQPVHIPPTPQVDDTPETPVAAQPERRADVGQSAKRYAEVEKRQWRREPLREFDDDENDDSMPNAYRSGSQWIGAEVDAPPSRWRETQSSNLYRGPDGRWYVRIGGHKRWNDDE